MLDRKIFGLMAVMAALLLAGCEEELPLPSDGMGKVLIVNGSLCSLEAEHTLWVACSSAKDGIVAPPAAKVSIYVNGTLAAESSEGVVRAYTDGMQVGYTVPAKFGPGDEVRVVADSELGRCESVQTVPAAPRALSLRMGEEVSLSYADHGNVRVADFTKLFLTVSDPSGEKNAYRIRRVDLDTETVCEKGIPYSYGERPKPGTSISKSAEVEIFNILEPVMMIPWNPLESSNDFNIFSDESFDGKEYTLTLCMKGGSKGLSYVTSPSLSGSYIDGVEYSDEWVRHSTIRLQLEALPYESYRYYMAVEYDSNNNVIPLAYEPGMFPGNVSGGLGYINISAGASVECSLPDLWFDMQHTHGYYK